MGDDINRFRDWMDSLGIKGPKAVKLAQAIGISDQTLRHWRSQGVPARRQSHVDYVMTQWRENDPFVIPQIEGQNLVLHTTPVQFRSWNRAALEARKTIEDWAIEGLDHLAKERLEQGYLSTPKAAEDVAPYKTGSQTKPAR